MEYGPKTRVGELIHAQKYRVPMERFDDSMTRVASGLKDSSAHFHVVRDILRDQRFLPGGRVQAAIGSPKAVTAFNCFVSGFIEDSFVDGDGSIMQRATEAAQTMRLGGGIGFDFSTLRPSGEFISKVQAKTDGPVAFMPIFDAVCKATSSAGNRRGAMLASLRIDHPDIEKFIHAKRNNDALTGFNTSVGVTDEFMHCMLQDKPFRLRFGGKHYGDVDPRALWETLMRSTWDWAEPGVLFLDTINRANNLHYCETIATTNPCGEQVLPPFGACLLGSVNLVKYVRSSGMGAYYFDIDAMRRDIPPIVRSMDNVIDRTLYPLKEQEIEAKSKRRIGIGVTALANAIEACGYPYGSDAFLSMQKWIQTVLRDVAYQTSIELSKEKGAFPSFKKELLDGAFAETLPAKIRDDIAKYGLRNSHLLSIAPTGTISLTADSVSSGIEPVFSYETDRLVNTDEGQRLFKLRDYGVREYGVYGKIADDVTAQEHIDVLAMATKLVDSAVSKTVNMDSSMPWEDFKRLYVDAWKNGCKGCATFNKDGKRMALLTAASEEKEVCYVDPQTGRKECS